MKNFLKFFALILILNAGFAFGEEYTSTCDPGANLTCSNAPYEYEIIGYYNSQAAAAAARDAYAASAPPYPQQGSINAQGGWGVQNSTCNGWLPGTTYRGYSTVLYWPWPNGYKTVYFLTDLTPGDGSCIVPQGTGDSDNDGISDGYDPFPNDDSNFTWEIIAWQKDENGDYTYLVVRATNEAGQVTYKKFGEEDPEELTYLEIGPEQRDGSDYASFFGGSGFPDQDYDNTLALGQGDHDINYGSGEGNTGNSLDLDYLEDIVTNTKQTADNQGQMGQTLDDISKRLEETNRILAQSGQDTGSGVGGASAVSIGAAVGSQITEDRETEETDSQEYTDQALDDINAIDEGSLFSGQEFDEEDAPEKNLLSDIFSDFMQNNPAADLLNNSEVNTSGSCSFSWSYNGHPIEFTVCNFASELQLMGTILLGLAGVSALFIIFRR